MKKVALALLVLAITVPAMAEVDITVSNDANVVTIGYETDGEIVRAFALNVDVNNGGFVAGSVVPNTDDYWVYPTNMTFTIVDGNTVVDEYGSPIAGESNAGGVLEMASLYGENDPCRQDAPPSSGTLCTFAIDANCAVAASFTVSLDLNAQRGGVVLEDPDAAVTVNLPSDLVVPCIPPHPCTLVVGEVIGGVLITQPMKDLHESLGWPDCWCYDCHVRGDTNGDNVIDSTDLLGTDGPGGAILDGWYDAWNTAYDACADTSNDGIIDSTDLLGTDGPGGAILDGWYDGWNSGCP
jgi:hypothetical protein